MTYGPYKLGGTRAADRCGRDRLLEATQDGMLDPQQVVEMCVRWMTSQDIYEMCTANEINLARITGD